MDLQRLYRCLGGNLSPLDELLPLYGDHLGLCHQHLRRIPSSRGAFHKHRCPRRYHSALGCGKSASSITDYIINSDTFNPKYCVSLLKSSLRDKADEVVASIEGFQMEQEQKSRARLVIEHYTFLVDEIKKIDNMLDVLAAPYEGFITLLCTIPGVDRQTAITIISEIGIDMAQFLSSKRLCCWAGLTPGNNESAGKKKSVNITRAGVYLKPALVQAAHAAVKDTKNPYYRIKYEHISKRRGKKRAIIAIARMILTAIYHMLSTGVVWTPCDLVQVDMPIELQKKHLQKTLNRAAQLLISNGVVSAEAISLPLSDSA